MHACCWSVRNVDVQRIKDVNCIERVINDAKDWEEEDNVGNCRE